MGIWLGLSAVLLAGLLQGLYAVPMKFAPGWKFENIWLAFSLGGMVVFPWILASATLPYPGQVYSLTSTGTLVRIAGFGLCWGFGAVMAGIGMTLLGVGLGMAIILGLSASVGSLIPFLILTPQQLHTHQGHTYLLGTVIMLVGIAGCAKAGRLRDEAAARGARGHRGSFLAGFIICCFSGLFSSALNFSYAFGSEAVERARELGASRVWSVGAVTTLAVAGGFVANLAYCGYSLSRNRTARNFISSGSGRGWICGLLMGLFWFGGQSLYGVGISRMGDLGVVIGWPLLMGMIIVTSNTAGLLTAEWSGAPPATKTYLGAGMVIILAALGVLAGAQRPA
jgi:L-rhamnose-H+ transport protein